MIYYFFYLSTYFYNLFFNYHEGKPMHQKTDSEFIEYFERKVRYTIRKYSLCTKKDKIGVAVSGGKDSTSCLYILNKLGYDVEALTIDVLIGNYTKKNLENLQLFCGENNIKLNEVSLREEFGNSLCFIKSIVNSKGHNFSSCRICGILKRYLLNKHSKLLGFDFLATGHNLDDETQTFLMNVFKNDLTLVKRQGPKSQQDDKTKFIKRIKPLYLLTEQETLRYSKIMKFPVTYEICPCSTNAHRQEFKNMLNTFEENHPDVKYKILNFHEKLIKNLTENKKNETNIDSIEKEKRKNTIISTCDICKEPSTNSVCKTCQIFIALKEDENDKQPTNKTGYCNSTL